MANPGSEPERVHVRVEEPTCVGSGTCVMIDPAHFRFVDGKGHGPDGAVEPTEELEDAIMDCPVQAIVRTPAD